MQNGDSVMKTGMLINLRSAIEQSARKGLRRAPASRKPDPFTTSPPEREGWVENGMRPNTSGTEFLFAGEQFKKEDEIGE